MIELDGVFTVIEPGDVGCETIVPVVFDSPHSGVQFPESFNTTAPEQKILWNCDMHVESLLEEAPKHGAILLYAQFLRSFIDLHRSLSDIDESMLQSPWPEPVEPSDKTRLGRGLIRKYADKDLLIYNHLLTVEEVQQRITNYYMPYHRTLKKLMDDLHHQHGKVWHINMHSMPPYGRALFEDSGARRPDVAMANKDGSTSSKAFFEMAGDTLKDLGYEVWMNKPYKGQILITAYSDPENDRHSIQIELNRKLYMNWDDTLAIHDGFERFKGDITFFIQNVCQFAARNG
ncbi:N-formylglutamate amidohydrolase [bacterium]|nr:N-formylglutamate amidohydrolase [bacterium]